MRSEIVYVKTRLQSDLHERLKVYGKKEDRSMNYLINKAVEFYLNQKESAKA